MTPDECDYSCAECQRRVCADNEPKCPHENAACDGCCELYHEETAA